MKSKALLVALAALSAIGLSGCFATVTVRQPTFTSNCYWETHYDRYGAYEQQYCWSPYYSGYRAYYSDGYYYRRYSPGYSGPRYRVRYGSPDVIVSPRRRSPAPVVVRPGGPRRRGRHHATHVAREALSISLDAGTVNAVSLEGNAFAAASVQQLNGAPVSRVTLEVVVAGVNRDAAQSLLQEIAEGRELSRGRLTLGEGVSDGSAHIESLHVLVPAGQRVSVR